MVLFCRKHIRRAKVNHDNVFLTKHVYPDISLETSTPKVNDRPYLLGHDTLGFEEEMPINIEKYSSISQNLYPDDQNPDNKYVWTSLFYLRRRIQGLCQGTVCGK